MNNAPAKQQLLEMAERLKEHTMTPPQERHQIIALWTHMSGLVNEDATLSFLQFYAVNRAVERILNMESRDQILHLVALATYINSCK